MLFRSCQNSGFGDAYSGLALKQLALGYCAGILDALVNRELRLRIGEGGFSLLKLCLGDA